MEEDPDDGKTAVVTSPMRLVTPPTIPLRPMESLPFEAAETVVLWLAELDVELPLLK